jgi:hypothetical protein
MHHQTLSRLFPANKDPATTRAEPYGIRPGPGACCPDAHYVDGKCTGCGHEEKVKP